MGGPKGVLQGQEAFPPGWQAPAGGVDEGGGDECPVVEQGGEGTEAALGVIAGADGVEFPAEEVLGFEPAEAGVTEFPPAGPELLEVGAGGVFVAVGMEVFEEACGAEEEGLAIEGIFFEQAFDGEALSEDGERALVVSVAEGLGEGLEDGLFPAVRGGEGVKAIGFEAEAVLGGAFDEIRNAFGIHVAEGCGAAAEACCGEAAFGGGILSEHGARDLGLGDFGVLVGAGEEALIRGRLEEDVEDDVLIVRIGAVVMAFPIANVGVELDVAGEKLVADADGAASEVRAGAGVPGAEVFDGDGTVVGGGEGGAEGAREPEALEIQFAHGWLHAWKCGGVFDACEDRITKALVAVSEWQDEEAHAEGRGLRSLSDASASELTLFHAPGKWRC